MKKISKKDFNEFSIPRIIPEEMMPWNEIEFYEKNNFISAITKDKIDHDFGFVIFKEKSNGEVVFFKNETSLKSKSEAIKRMSNFI
jgi:hypothetical protein